MAIDEELRAALRTHLSALDDIEEKTMFGGAGFMWRGNLLCGVMGDDLLIRIAKEDAESFTGDVGARPMVMGGRTSKGWILVPVPRAGREELLTKWVDRAISYGGTLPPK